MTIVQIKKELKEALSKALIEIENLDTSDVSETGGEHLADFAQDIQSLINICNDDVDLEWQSSDSYYDSGC